MPQNYEKAVLSSHANKARRPRVERRNWNSFAYQDSSQIVLTSHEQMVASRNDMRSPNSYRKTKNTRSYDPTSPRGSYKAASYRQASYGQSPENSFAKTNSEQNFQDSFYPKNRAPRRTNEQYWSATKSTKTSSYDQSNVKTPLETNLNDDLELEHNATVNNQSSVQVSRPRFEQNSAKFSKSSFRQNVAEFQEDTEVVEHDDAYYQAQVADNTHNMGDDIEHDDAYYQAQVAGNVQDQHDEIEHDDAYYQAQMASEDVNRSDEIEHDDAYYQAQVAGNVQDKHDDIEHDDAYYQAHAFDNSQDNAFDNSQDNVFENSQDNANLSQDIEDESDDELLNFVANDKQPLPDVAEIAHSKSSEHHRKAATKKPRAIEFDSLSSLMNHFNAQKRHQKPSTNEKSSEYVPVDSSLAEQIMQEKGLSLLEAAALAVYQDSEPVLRSDIRKEILAQKQAKALKQAKGAKASQQEPHQGTQQVAPQASAVKQDDNVEQGLSPLQAAAMAVYKDSEPVLRSDIRKEILAQKQAQASDNASENTSKKSSDKATSAKPTKSAKQASTVKPASSVELEHKNDEVEQDSSSNYRAKKFARLAKAQSAMFKSLNVQGQVYEETHAKSLDEEANTKSLAKETYAKLPEEAQVDDDEVEDKINDLSASSTPNEAPQVVKLPVRTIVGVDVWEFDMICCLDRTNPDQTVSQSSQQFMVNESGLQEFVQWLRDNDVSAVNFCTHGQNYYQKAYEFCKNNLTDVELSIAPWQDSAYRKLEPQPSFRLAQDCAISLRLHGIQQSTTQSEDIRLKIQKASRNLNQRRRERLTLRRSIDTVLNRTHFEICEIFDQALDPVFINLMIKAYELKDNMYDLEDYVYDTFENNRDYDPDAIWKALEKDLEMRGQDVADLYEHYSSYTALDDLPEQVFAELEPSLPKKFTDLFYRLKEIPSVDTFMALTFLGEVGANVFNFRSLFAFENWILFLDRANSNNYMHDAVFDCVRNIIEDKTNHLHVFYINNVLPKVAEPEKAQILLAKKLIAAMYFIALNNYNYETYKQDCANKSKKFRARSSVD